LRSFGERLGLVPASPTTEPESLEHHPVDLNFASTNTVDHQNPLVAKDPGEPNTPWCDDPKIHVDVREEIERWEPQLRAMGWSEERIWRPFWPHSAEHPRGLASILGPGDRIRFCDPDFIWLIKRDGTEGKIPR
jgi:hypothetical protein